MLHVRNTLSWCLVIQVADLCFLQQKAVATVYSLACFIHPCGTLGTLQAAQPLLPVSQEPPGSALSFSPAAFPRSLSHLASNVSILYTTG